MVVRHVVPCTMVVNLPLKHTFSKLLLDLKSSAGLQTGDDSRTFTTLENDSVLVRFRARVVDDLSAVLKF